MPEFTMTTEYSHREGCWYAYARFIDGTCFTVADETRHGAIELLMRKLSILFDSIIETHP